MVPGRWTELVALVAGYAAAVLTTPAGVSGAVLLLPFQVRVLGIPPLAATPTNLLYNVIATPGASYRYWRQRQIGGRLALVLIAGTLPGVIAGTVIRAELLPGPRVFNLLVATVLAPLGAWLLLTRSAPPREPVRSVHRIPGPALVVLAAVVGCVGGTYGVGGGAILAPIPIGSGRSPSQAAPAALAATFVTSAAGVISFTILSVQTGAVAPDGPAYPAEMAEAFGTTRANLSNHLACLRECGLVTATAEGRRIRYELADQSLADGLRIEVPVQQEPDRRRVVGRPLSLHVTQKPRQLRGCLCLGPDRSHVPAFFAGDRVLTAIDPDP